MVGFYRYFFFFSVGSLMSLHLGLLSSSPLRKNGVCLLKHEDKLEPSLNAFVLKKKKNFGKTLLLLTSSLLKIKAQRDKVFCIKAKDALW